MRFVADENVDRQIIAALREAGHTVRAVVEDTPSVSDDTVIQQAQQNSAVLVTADRDFGELVFRQGRITAGVLLLRLAGLPGELKARYALSAVEAHGAELSGNFTVVTSKAVRIRRLPHR